MQGTVLVVEDESDLRSLVRRLLERTGFEVREAATGREALRMLFDEVPDLVVLDVGLPELDGWAVLERVREVSDVPVLMLTAQGGELQKVRGLRSGADDYMTKPFGRQELVARCEALLRRSGPVRSEAVDALDDGYVRIDFAEHRVTVQGDEVALTPLEFRLLAAFVRNPSRLLSHDQLLELVWNEEDIDGRDRVKLYVGYLRRKLLGVSGSAPIETVRGMGYRYSGAAP